jgi:MFS family permease
MLADYYPKRLRGRVFAVFFAAIPIGSALGYVLGGIVGARHGWRAAFFVAGLPGLLLAALTLLVRDPVRGVQDEEEKVEPGRSLAATYLGLLRNGPYSLTVLGYAAYTFALGGMAFWMPSFLERVRALPHEQATQVFGAVVVVTGFVGTFLGGWLGDLFLKRSAQAYLWVSGIATLLAVPLVAIALTDVRPAVYWPAMAISELLLFVSTGPINSAIVNVVSPGERATAVAVSIFAIHFLGDVPSPVIIGTLSDAYARYFNPAEAVTSTVYQAAGLQRAIYLVPVAVAVAGLIWSAAAWRGRGRGPTS